MTTTIAIPPLARSACEAAEEEGLKPALDALAETVAEGANWKVRQRTLLDIIAVIEAATSADLSAGEAELMLGAAGAGPRPTDGGGEKEAENDGDDDEEEGDDEDEEEEEEYEDDDDDLDPEGLFLASLPMYMAAILERLGESRIVCVEQAAFYLLSAHPEHQEAAQQWIEADYRNERSYRKFLRAQRYYRSVLERGVAAADPFDEAEEAK